MKPKIYSATIHFSYEIRNRRKNAMLQNVTAVVADGQDPRKNPYNTRKVLRINPTARIEKIELHDFLSETAWS